MQFKAVKNPNRPGRPPGGSEWVKDADNNIITNDKGEFAFQPASATPKKKQGKRAGKKKTAAKGTGRKVAAELPENLKSTLLLKKTYKDFSSEELAKIRDIAAGLIDKAKQAEAAKLQKQIESLQGKLKKLK